LTAKAVMWDTLASIGRRKIGHRP